MSNQHRDELSVQQVIRKLAATFKDAPLRDIKAVAEQSAERQETSNATRLQKRVP